ncbi:hypothetical protein AAVH_02546 [Aphelenchoides avenae]|nr:hypothetical protein AAVH_02546 [Aphelenchus avenae]
MKSIYLDDVTAAKRVASRIDKYSDVDEMLYDMNRASPPMARAAKQAMTYAKDKVKDWKYSLDRDAIDFARRAGKSGDKLKKLTNGAFEDFDKLQSRTQYNLRKAFPALSTIFGSPALQDLMDQLF